MVLLADPALLADLSAWVLAPRPPLGFGAAACVACFSGPPGVGKMTMAAAVAAGAAATLQVLQPDRLHGAGELLDQLEKWCTTQAFEDAFQATQRAATVVVLDALDAFLAADRTLLASMAARFRAVGARRWRPVPLLVLCAPSQERRVCEAFKGCARFAAAAPSEAAARAFFAQALPKAGAGAVGRLAKQVAADGNVARALFAAAPVARPVERRVSDLWTTRLTRPEARSLLEQDPLNVLRFHENVLRELERRRVPVRERRRTLAAVLAQCVEADQMEGEVAVEHAAGAVTHWMARLPLRKAAATGAAAPAEPCFTKMLSNLSLQKKAQRRAAASAAQAFFPTEHIGAYRLAMARGG